MSALAIAAFTPAHSPCGSRISTEEGKVYEEGQTDIEKSLSQFDFTQLEDFISENLKESNIGFYDLVSRLITQKEMLSAQEIVKKMFQMLLRQVEKNRLQGIQILMLVVCSSVLSSIAAVFESEQISQQAWFVIFLMVIACALTGFLQSCSMVTSCLRSAISFMKLLIPAFCLSMVCITGASASGIYYQATFGIVALVETALLYGILPIVKLYFGVSALNGLTGGERFSGIEELLKVIYDWSMKTLCAIVVGMQVIQGLIVPLASGTRAAFAQKLLGALPGIGNGIKSTAEIIVGTAALIKNGIGMAGCIFLVMAGIYPILQMAAIVLIYYGVGAIVSPVADKRMSAAIKAVSYTNRMLLKALCLSVFLFFVTIAVICAFTNRVA